MIRVIVIDDEPVARRGLVKLVEDEADLEVIATAAEGEEAVRSIREHKPDLIFLDIQMPKVDGLAVAETVRALDPAPVVVFVTAYADHAARAFELDAVDYLTKPFDRDRFRQTARRAKREIRRAALDRLNQGVGVLERLGERGAGSRIPDRLVVKDSGRIVFVQPHEVNWVEAAGNYVRIKTESEVHLVRSTLSEMEESLERHGFKRISRSTLVNLARVREIKPGSSGTQVLVLDDGRRFAVSRRSWPELRREIERMRSRD